MVTAQAEKQLAAMLAEVTDEVQFEAREIIRETAGRRTPLDELSEKEYGQCLLMVNRRLTGEPLQYIFGHWEFYGYDFSVGEGVLIPRPETELLCDIAIKHLKAFGGEFADLCAGSGCIAITVAKQTGLSARGVEISDKAYSYFCENIKKNNAEKLVCAIKGDIFDTEVTDSFEDGSLAAVLSNPPYINKKDMESLQKEVRYEPETALFGGDDGLDYYRRIFGVWSSKLKKGGLFAVEIGDEQGQAVKHLMEQEGYAPEIVKDYSGKDRIVKAIKQ